jgi:hypothetical protein
VDGDSRKIDVEMGTEYRRVVRSTYQQIADRANEAREIFKQRGIKLHRDSSLAKLLRSAVDLSTLWNSGERARNIREVLAASHASRVAGAIVAMTGEANAIWLYTSLMPPCGPCPTHWAASGAMEKSPRPAHKNPDTPSAALVLGARRGVLAPPG